MFRPNETPLPFANVRPPSAPLVDPADTDSVAAAAVLAEIVIEFEF